MGSRAVLRLRLRLRGHEGLLGGRGALIRWPHLSIASEPGADARRARSFQDAANGLLDAWRPAVATANASTRTTIFEVGLDVLPAPLQERADPSEGAEALAVLALAERGLLVLHAAAFRVMGVGVLILGPTGRGKSTICGAALRSGGRVLGDDLVALLGSGRRPRLVPLRRHLSFRDELPGIAGLMPSCDALGAPRWVLSPAASPRSFLPFLSPDVLWCLAERSPDGASRLDALSGAVGLGWLIRAGSPLVLASGSPVRETASDVVRSTLERLPALSLVAGRDLLDEPAETLRRLLRVPPAPPRPR